MNFKMPPLPELILTILVTCLIAAVLLRWVDEEAKLHRQKEGKEPTEGAGEPKRSAPTGDPFGTLAVIGWLVCGASLAFGAYTYFAFDNTVETASGGSVFNFARDSERWLRLGASAVGVIGGLVVGFGAGVMQGMRPTKSE